MTPSLDAEALKLDRRARLVLECLEQNFGAVVSKQALMAYAWPEQIVEENSLHQAIGRLRRKLKGQAASIEVVHGRGYRFCLAEPAVTAPAFEATGSGKRRWIAIAVVLALGGSVTGAWLYRSTTTTARTPAAETALLNYLSDEMLIKADPYSGKAYDPATRPLVEQLIRDADKRFGAEPETLARLQFRFGTVLAGWGQYGRAEVHMERAAQHALAVHGKRSPDYVTARTAQCEIARMAGQLESARQLCAEVLELSVGDQSLVALGAINAQAKLDFEVGHYVAAVDRLAPILAQAGGGPLKSVTADKAQAAVLADAYWFSALSARKLARFDLAEKAFLNLLDIRTKVWGRDHPLTTWALSDYGDLLVDLGRFAEARPRLIEAEAQFFASLGKDHPDTYSPRYSLALIELEEGRPKEAVRQFTKIEGIYVRALGPRHLWTLYTRTNLALALARSGRKDEARSMLTAVMALTQDTIYGKPAKLGYFQMRWAETMLSLGREAEAGKLADDSLQTIKTGIGSGHPWEKRLAEIKREAD